jgi:ribose transport system ATP-binding protein
MDAVPSALPFLQLRGLTKAYASPVLQDVDLALEPGEVHALVGENGAGKSTLSRIIAGLTRPDRGELLLEGRPYTPRSRGNARAAGVHLVLQELNLIATLSVAENVFLDELPRRHGWVDYARLYTATSRLLQRLGMGELDPRAPVAELGLGQQQMVEIAATLWRHCRLLILDEPTAALSEQEVQRLFSQVRSLRSRGVTVLYISHRLEEIRQIADRLSVLRDGRLVATRAMGEFDLSEVIRLMVGREVARENVSAPRTIGEVALRVVGLSRGDRVRNVSFCVRRGEILGFAGLMGSGRTETLRAIFGADRRSAGQVHLGNSDAPVRIRSPREAVRRGLALVPEDRKAQGLFLPLSVRENLTINALRRVADRMGWLRRARETREARHWIARMTIRCRSPDQVTRELSGGNQQKLLLARWLYRDCDVLMVDEPTRGVDVGARLEIHRLLLDLAGRGKAIVMVSSDLNELLSLCDRIAVMSAGRLAATFNRGDWTQDRIMTAALSGHLAAPRGQPQRSGTNARDHEPS